MDDTAPTDDDLHAALDTLLSQMPLTDQPATEEAAGALWDFVSMIAFKRGIEARYQKEGHDAVGKTPDFPRPTKDARTKERYHQAILRQLVLDVGGDPNSARPLPKNFEHGLVAFDLASMLGDVGNFGKNEAILLKNQSTSRDSARATARIAIVREVYRRVAAQNITRASVLDHFGIEKTTFDSWLRQGGMDIARVRGEVGAQHGEAGLTDEEVFAHLEFGSPQKP
jgi:hypothetical protein